MRRVVITGLGAVTPIGNSVSEFCDSLSSCRSGISKITKFDTSNFSVKIAGEVKNLSFNNYFSTKEQLRWDSFVKYAMIATKEAINDAKLTNFSSVCGVIVASGIGGIETWEREFLRLQQSPRRVSPFFIPMMIINSVSAEIAIKYKLSGPNYSLVSACASSLHAICDAYYLIKHGLADVMITGGSEAAITPLSVAGFSNMRALSTRNDEPEKASRPFDKDRDGFVLGEGAGIIILEELNHALSRGVTPYCEILGCGMTCDAYHMTAPEPTGEVVAKTMELALKESKISPNEVDYINAHGTSTKLNDVVETMGIKKVFNDYAYKIHISSTKSMIGHLLGAAASVELIATILSIKNSVIYPTINLDNTDPACDLNYTPNKPIKKEINIAMKNSFGFGGHNASIVIKKFM